MVQILSKNGLRTIKLDAAEKRAISRSLEVIDGVSLVNEKWKQLLSGLTEFRNLYCIDTDEPAKERGGK